MLRSQVVVIGAGQSGLAVSALLTAAAVDHVVLERGRTAQRWRAERWASLRLLTPNWMTRLPGWAYRGDDPDGFLTAAEVTEYLDEYATSFSAPLLHHAPVHFVRPAPAGGYRVVSDAGTFTADAVVVATGYCERAAKHAAAERIHPGVTQLDATSYRSPADAGRHVLVVGASATGVQLADELAASGRRVVLAVGRHTRMPRSYRGMDIFWWLDSMGTLSRPLDPARRRHEPSLQLSGRSPAHTVDLNALAGRGIALTGRLLDVRDGVARFADDLTNTTADADRRLNRLLDRIDEHATAIGLDGEVDDPIRPSPTTPMIRPARIDVGGSGVDTVLWATGYARSYPWLQVPGVLGPDGEILQRAGITPAPGLVVLGMAGQTRLSSTYLDGVRYDAEALVDHLCTDVLRMPVRSRS